MVSSFTINKAYDILTRRGKLGLKRSFQDSFFFFILEFFTVIAYIVGEKIQSDLKFVATGGCVKLLSAV